MLALSKLVFLGFSSRIPQSSPSSARANVLLWDESHHDIDSIAHEQVTFSSSRPCWTMLGSREGRFPKLLTSGQSSVVKLAAPLPLVFQRSRLTSLLYTTFSRCTITGSCSELCPSTSADAQNGSHQILTGSFSWDKALLTSSRNRHRLQLLDPPLDRDPQIQTQFLTRLHLFLVSASSNSVCPPLTSQCTIDTSFDKARVSVSWGY